MSSITRFIGIDQSKKSMEVCIVNNENTEIKRFKYDTNPEGIQNFISTLSVHDVVALETGNNAFRIAKHILNKVQCSVYVLNAGELHMIFKSLKKTDKEDALKIAQFIQRYPKEELPLVVIPSDEKMAMRALAQHQNSVKNMRTAKLNELHCLLWNSGIADLCKNELKKKFARQIIIEKLAPAYKKIALRICTAIDLLEEQIEDIELEEKELLCKRKEEITISMSMPGIGLQAAFVVSAFLGKMENFGSKRQVGFYAGFTPRVDCSGDQIRFGNITKSGPSQLRRVMNQAAWAAIRSNDGLRFKEMYERIKAHRGVKRAIVAVSRKMLEILFIMHKRNELFDACTDHGKLISKLKLYGIIAKSG